MRTGRDGRLTLESDRLYVHAEVAQPRMSVLYAKSFKERDTDLSNTDRRLGFLRELNLALYLDAVCRGRT